MNEKKKTQDAHFEKKYQKLSGNDKSLITNRACSSQEIQNPQKSDIADSNL